MVSVIENMEEPFCSMVNSPNVRNVSSQNKSLPDYYSGNTPSLKGLKNSDNYRNVSATRPNGVVHSNSNRNQYKFGGPDVRASYNEHSSPHVNTRTQFPHYKFEKSPQRSQSERTNRWVWEDNGPSPTRTALYRSNSSLDLDEMLDEKALGLRREYGSASSIDVISAATGENFMAILRKFEQDSVDHCNAGSTRNNYYGGKADYSSVGHSAYNALSNGSESVEDASSPKVKSKFHKLWDSKDKNKNKPKNSNNEISLFRKLRGSRSEASVDTTTRGSDNSLDADMRAEEKMRRKAFAHYDVQSVTANLCYAARLRGILSRRRNTTTGASAASMLNRNAMHDSSEDLSPEENDNGDGRSNELVSTCPFFRNELGGEEERTISLTRVTGKRPKNSDDHKFRLLPLHKPNMACGLSVLENASENFWKKWNCPFEKHNLQIENVDHGVYFYNKYFYGKEHQNWFGIDENLGPVAISLCKEKIEDTGLGPNKDSCPNLQYQYRVIVRTSELTTLRGSILEDVITSLKPSTNRGIPAKEILEFVAPELQLNTLRLGVSNSHVEDQLLKVDEQGITNHYKVGIMYCKDGQSTEEEMYNNETAGPAFEEFLDMIGERVRLKGFTKYRAQLDNKTDSTGLYSVYSSFQDYEIMFHVSTMLPHTPNNRQQLLRKRHIGNDIVTIVFQEPNALPFSPKNIRSHFQHVFIIIRAINPCSENTRYSIAVTRSKEVPVFGPLIPEGATFMKSKAFADLLLAKVINAENAAHKSEKFATMATRTRQEYLKDLATNYVSHTTLESAPKFSIFGGKKKERPRCRFFPDACVRGAIVWQVQVEDYGQACTCDCFLGISADTVILIEEVSREPVFVTPSVGILGWSSQSNSLKLYYHHGECVVLRSRDHELDEIQEIVSRLCNVTQGGESQEITLRRNNLGQLGFHVQHDGTITEVEPFGFAWQAGLRQGSRLVEICKVVVSSLTHDQMIDLLKTSMMVTVTIIPPLPDGTSRRGCRLQNCSSLMNDLLLSDYENLSNCELNSNHSKMKNFPRQQIAQSQIKVNRNDASISPPRSSASSGYSSGRSGLVIEQRLGMVNCSSSQSSEEKWYDVAENVESEERSLPLPPNNVTNVSTKESSPPPLPARLVPNSNSAFSHVTPKRREQVQQQQPSSAPRHAASHSYDYSSTAYVHTRGYSMDCKQKLNISERHNEFYGHDYGRFGGDGRHDHGPAPQQFSRDGEKAKTAVLASPAIVISDGHSDSSSDRLQGARSEDDLSGSSNSLSPKFRRRWGVENWGTGSSGSSSRNHSPHISNRGGTDGGEAKLRPGVTTRAVNRNSGMSISTFQEDLLKLINPDLINKRDEKQLSGEVASSTYTSNHKQEVKVALGDVERVEHKEKQFETSTTNDTDVIFTTARPATVISTTSSSPVPSENKHSKEDSIVASKSSLTVGSDGTTTTMSGHHIKPSLSADSVPLPEVKEIDWPSLVDTATRAMQRVPAAHKTQGNWKNDMSIDMESKMNARGAPILDDTIHRIRDLEARVKILESDLERERHGKAVLEVEVLSLREENLRLQEESQASQSQLRHFTEWFFRTLKHP